jgi:hypothetical protein
MFLLIQYIVIVVLNPSKQDNVSVSATKIPKSKDTIIYSSTKFYLAISIKIIVTYFFNTKFVLVP